MAHILIADVETAQELIKQVVGNRHCLDFAQHIAEVEKLLQISKYDLIVIGINFDESRAFECLRMIKENPEWRATPVVLFGHCKSQIRGGFDETMQAMARTFGSQGYIDRAEFEGKADPNTELLCEFERYLPQELQTKEDCAERSKEKSKPSNLAPEDVNKGPWS